MPFIGDWLESFWFPLGENFIDGRPCLPAMPFPLRMNCWSYGVAPQREKVAEERFKDPPLCAICRCGVDQVRPVVCVKGGGGGREGAEEG